MDIISLLGISFGLAADSFAVSICKGLSTKKLKLKNIIIIGLWFGIFQALMPFIGFILGSAFSGFIKSIDHWISFILLAYIGIKLILDSGDEQAISDSVNVKEMLLLAIATSIDALAVGITFSFLDVNIYFAIFLIGIIAFVCSMIGVCIGFKFGSKYEKISRIIGGIILIIIGLRILIEHLFF